MTQKVLTSLLLLLLCGSVAAEPTHKRTTTVTTRRAASEKQNVKSAPKEPSAEETPVSTELSLKVSCNLCASNTHQEEMSA